MIGGYHTEERGWTSMKVTIIVFFFIIIKGAPNLSRTFKNKLP